MAHSVASWRLSEWCRVDTRVIARHGVPCADGEVLCIVGTRTTWVPARPLLSSSFQEEVCIEVHHQQDPRQAALSFTGHRVPCTEGEGSAQLGGLSRIDQWGVDFCSGPVSVCHRLMSRAFVDRPCLAASLSSASLVTLVQLSLFFFSFLSLKKVPTAKNCADVGTKPVSASVLQQHCKFAGKVFY